MKATIPYEVLLHVFEVMYSEDLLIFECLLLEMYSKCKGKKSVEKQTKVKYQNEPCRWKRDSFSREIEIRRGMV